MVLVGWKKWRAVLAAGLHLLLFTAFVHGADGMETLNDLYKGVSHLSLCSVVVTMDMAPMLMATTVRRFLMPFKTLEDLEKEIDPVAYCK